MTRRSTLAAGFLLCLAAHAPAQISLSSAVDLALRNDPRAKMAEADVRKAQATVSEAHDAYIPTIAANAGVGESVGVPLSLPVIFGVSSQSLIFNFSQKDNIRAARLGLDAAQLQLQEIRSQIAEDVAVTYLNLDTAQRRRDAMTQEDQFARRLVTIVQERLDAGQDTRMELLKARKTAAQIRLAQLQAEDDIAILSDHLARLMGLPGNPVAAIGASIPAMPALSSLTTSVPESYGVQAAFSTAESKQHLAFGENRYQYRPQVSLGANYSRISTDFTNYALYYPGFRNGLSENAISVGMQIQVPLLDRTHQARAHEAAADAARAHFEAQSQQNQFLEGQFKLRHSATELQLRAEVASLDVDLAQEQLDAIVTQSSSDAAGTTTTQVTPKDEQNARLLERQKYVEMLDAQAQLRQAQINLMRQTRQLDDWLKLTPAPVSSPALVPVVP